MLEICVPKCIYSMNSILLTYRKMYEYIYAPIWPNNMHTQTVCDNGIVFYVDTCSYLLQKNIKHKNHNQ